MEQRSALSNFNITQWPIGTKAELVAAGFDPATVASCSDGKDGTRPCPVFAACRHRFKGTTGPHYIGYRYIDPAIGDATEDIAKCHAYVLTLQAQADAGAAQRRVSGGKKGKIIRVIANEGEEIVTRYYLPVNGKGQVINVMPEMVDILKNNGTDYSVLPNEVSVTWRFFELKRTVPRMPRPGEAQGDSYAHRIARRDMSNDDMGQEYPAPEFAAPTASETLDEPLDDDVSAAVAGLTAGPLATAMPVAEKVKK